MLTKTWHTFLHSFYHQIYILARQLSVFVTEKRFVDEYFSAKKLTLVGVATLEGTRHVRSIITSFEMHLGKGALWFPHYLQLGCSRENTARCASADKKIYKFYIAKVHFKRWNNCTHVPCSLQSPHSKGIGMITSLFGICPVNRTVRYAYLATLTYIDIEIETYFWAIHLYLVLFTWDVSSRCQLFHWLDEVWKCSFSAGVTY